MIWWLLIVVAVLAVLWLAWVVWGWVLYVHARGESAGYARALRDRSDRQ